MENRVTLRFAVDSGNQYLYDDASGMTFVWSDLRERVLSSLLRGDLAERRAEWSDFLPEEIHREVRFVSEWRQRYGAFARLSGSYPDVPEPDELEAWIRKEIVMQLTLVVTDDCNLRCRYCTFSDKYQLTRNRGSSSMSLDLALRAVDYFLELARPEIERNPRRLFGLTFYGGEPLLEIDLISKVIKYAKERYGDLCIPVMTVNGTLLTESTSQILADHDAHVSVSLDGPQPDQDRLRVFPSGDGSYESVMRNLRRIRREMPDFFAKNLTAVCVYDYKTDIENASEFFLSSAEPAPPAVFVSSVASRNTNYYDAFTETDYDGHIAQVRRLKEDYKRRVIAGEKSSSYSQAFVGFPIASCLLRRRLANVRPAFLPFSGACIPGMKLCVQTDGRIDICERVNGTFPIGHMDNGGVDFSRVREAIKSFRDSACQDCFSCPITRLCVACFSLTEGDGGFQRSAATCARTIASARGDLADYYSIKERNPSADFAYETDRVYLERRLMFT